MRQDIFLGDAYKLIKELEDNSIDLIVTDPPYDIEGLQDVGGSYGSGILKDRPEGYLNELKNKGLDQGLDIKILDDFCRVLKKINIYIWCSKQQLLTYFDYFVKNKKCNFELIVWAKSNPIPFCGTHYLCDKEYCLYFWEQGAKIQVPFERGKTVYFSKTNTDDKRDFGHPCIKPIELIESFILNSSQEGDFVLDAFVGSGTTALAAKHTKRNFIGFEIDKNYFEKAVDRLNGINQRGEINLFDIGE